MSRLHIESEKYSKSTLRGEKSGLMFPGGYLQYGMEKNLELVGESLVQLGVAGSVVGGSISVTSSRKRRSQSWGDGSFKSLSSADSSEFAGEHLLLAKQVSEKLGGMEEQLVMRMDQQEQFKSVDNQLACQVKDPNQSSNQNQLQQKAAMSDQQAQMGALIWQTKALIVQRDDSSRDLEKQQTAFSPQFAQMEQWKSGPEQEIPDGVSCRKDLADPSSSKQ